MARRWRQPAPSTSQIVTPAPGVTKELEPITFGNFLPEKFQAKISLHADEIVSVEPQLKSNDADPANLAVRKLQFSDIAISEHSSPTMAEVVRGNHNMGKALSFVPPIDRDGKKVVQISADELKTQSEYWSASLIGYIIEDNPTDKSLENFVMHVWNFVAKPQILMHSDGYCIFRFNSVEDKNLVIQYGPYSYMNKPMMLKPWDVDFSFQNDVLSTIPVWVRFPGLLVGYWSSEILSKLASAIGKPLYTDKITAHFEKISYARVLVEVDAAFPLLEEIEIETPFGMKIQGIEYDWKPEFCNHCLKFGHNFLDCWYNGHNGGEQELQEQSKELRKRPRGRKPRQEWIPKANKENKDALESEAMTTNTLPSLPVHSDQPGLNTVSLVSEAMRTNSLPSMPVYSVQPVERMQRIQINTDMAASHGSDVDHGNQESDESDATGILMEQERGKVVAGFIDDGRKGQQQDPGPSLCLPPNIS